MAKSLPTATRTVATIKAPGDLIKEQLRLILTSIEDAPQVDIICCRMLQSMSRFERQLQDLGIRSLGALTKPIVNPFAIPSGLNEALFLKLSEMRTDSRLPHVGDLLNLVDGKFILLEQGNESQTGRIGNESQGSKQVGFHGLMGDNRAPSDWGSNNPLTEAKLVISSNQDTSIC